VDIQGSIITIDALGTQKQIARQIVEQEADYVLALKKNHKQLHQAVVSHIAEVDAHSSLASAQREAAARW
jgi:predicted transposase YbfD/YdcC